MNKYRFSVRNMINRIKNPSYDAEYLLYNTIENTGIIRSYYRRKLIKKYGIFISKEVRIGENIKLPHPNGIIIGQGTEIGDNVTIYQQVTIGGKNTGDTKAGRIAYIGDNVILFAGVKVLGEVTIESGTQVGANAVLIQSTEQNSVYAGVPAERKSITKSVRGIEKC